MAFLGQEEQIREFQDRFKFLYAVLFLGLGLLVSRLVFLQILKGDQMRQYSEENRIKRVKVAAPRGMVFDRNHQLLIDNRPDFDLENCASVSERIEARKARFGNTGAHS